MTPALKRFSLAARRAHVTSQRRFGIVTAFALALVTADLVGAPVPVGVYQVMLAWFGCAAAYVLFIRPLGTPWAANFAQTVAYCADLVLLSVLLAFLGGAWWLGPALHALIMVGAFATIPRRFAGWVAATALATYLLLGIGGMNGLFGTEPFMGVPMLVSHPQLATLVIGTGAVGLVVLALILDSAIRWMRRNQERYRGLVQTVPDAIIAVDQDGRVLSANEAAVRMLQSERDAIYGATLSSVVPDALRSRAMENYRAALGGASCTFACEVPDADGATHLDCSCTPLVEDEEIAGVLFVARDVTQAKRDVQALRRSEEQLRSAQKMEAIGQLAGGIAHDFNNVLSVILGYTQFLKATLEPGDERHHDIEAMESAADGAASLTRQLLAFGRKQVVKPRLLDMNNCVRELEEVLRRTLGSNIEIVTGLGSGVTLSADPIQLEQILLNLALNARDAMPDGGVLTIETRVAELDDSYRRTHAGVNPGTYVVLAVTDTGCGMDEATQARIFEPFFTTKPAGKGTGLGLPTVYGIVRQSGGHVWVYSEPGKGTTFRIYFPYVEALEDTGVYRIQQLRPPGGSETILLVDDAEQLRPLLVRSLRECGYNVIEAKNGTNALEQARDHIGSIDLLVTDLVMPGLSGPALAEELTALRPETRVLFMSGYSETAVSRRGRLRDGSAFLAKPFTPDVLAREVRTTLDMARKEVA
jgi:two-component system, cell cycle sensor histidine kinase and response regulator CckA